MFDYESLKLIWWVLVGVLLIGFALTDGFDLGAAALLPFVGRTDQERRVVINTIAPHWDGNQVWLITAGGALFAAWPLVYAASFSGFYWAMLLVLFAMFVRPAFENRGLGRLLMAAAEAELFQAHERIFLVTDGRQEIRANGFYQRLGWTVVSRVDAQDVRYEKRRPRA